jgi:hypothetical protein
MRQQARCLGRARECERLAELATDVSSRQTYLRMAGQWRALAADRAVVQQFDGLLAATSGRKDDDHDPSVGSTPI